MNLSKKTIRRIQRGEGLKVFVEQELEMLKIPKTQPSVTVEEHQLNRNEYDLNSKPFEITDPDCSEESDEEFDWYKHELNAETYFCLVNVERRTLQPGE